MRKSANTFGRHRPFDVGKKPPDEDVFEQIMEYMLLANNIRAIIRSRDDLRACGNDSISDRIMKGAEPKAVKFMKRIIKATIRCGRVFDSRKAAQTIPIYKKGNEPIPRTEANHNHQLHASKIHMLDGESFPEDERPIWDLLIRIIVKINFLL
jgi:hypothetical protein